MVFESSNPLYFYSILISMPVRRCLLLSAVVRRSQESTIASLARRKVDGEVAKEENYSTGFTGKSIR
jgi:hypothetical protein